LDEGVGGGGGSLGARGAGADGGEVLEGRERPLRAVGGGPGEELVECDVVVLGEGAEAEVTGEEVLEEGVVVVGVVGLVCQPHGTTLEARRCGVGGDGERDARLRAMRAGAAQPISPHLRKER